MSSVSAIIPVYNGEATIRDAVESALALAGECDLEVVVVDDGSTDSTPNILRGYSKRIRVLHQNNLGVSAARNHGVRESRGEYLAFLDADDLWLPGRLSKAVQALDSDPKIGLVYSGYKILDIETGDLFLEVISEGVPTLQEIFEYRFGIVTAAVTVRREIFALCGGYDERLAYGEDYLLYLCARHHCNFFHIPEYLTLVRTTRVPDRRKKPAQTRLVFERVMRERFGSRVKVAIRGAHDQWARMLLGTALEELDKRRFRLALSAFLELLRYQPSYLLRANPTRIFSSRNIRRLLRLTTAVKPMRTGHS
jgi:glycosyltransferase involved in cell wall biosynthesis